MDATVYKNMGRFIDIPEKTRTREEILDLNIVQIKGIKIKTAEILKTVLGITKIRELSEKIITKEHVKLMKAMLVSPTELANWVFMAKMIKESKFEEFAGTSKISVFGLANAGKTALLNVLQGNLNIEVLTDIKPTTGANRVLANILDLDYSIWDMGGQDLYREEYISNAELYFLHIDLLIFVVDIQDNANYQKALSYLKDIINIIENLKENPDFLIMLHKVDPKLQEDKDTQARVAALTSQVKKIFSGKSFGMDILTSSIFQWTGQNKTITKEVRSFLTDTKGKGNDSERIELLTDSMEKIFNMVINLSASIDERISKLEEGIGELASMAKSVPKKDIKKYDFKKVNLKVDGLRNELMKVITKRRLD